MKKKILAWLLCAVMVAVMLPAPMASAADFYEDVESFVLTDEGDSTLIEWLVAAGCDNLYEALVYVRNNMDAGAPAELTGRLDNLITDLDSLGGSGEVFTGSLTNFTGGNSPVGINADGTFTRADFSVYDYHGHAGFSAYDGNVMYTYPLDYAQNGIYIGSNIIDMGGGLTKEVNYKAFGIAWEEAEPTSFVLSNEEGGLIDQLIAAGYGANNLYEAVVALQVTSGGVITDDFLEALAGNPGDSDIFTEPLTTFANAANNPIAINTDGTAHVIPIFGRNYYGQTGYSTYPASSTARESFTYTDSPEYYIAAGSDGSGGSYKAFAIAWMPNQVPTFMLSNEEDGLIDKLIAAGHEDDSLYEVLQLLQPISGGTIPADFMSALAARPADCDAKTALLSDFADESNNPIGIGLDGNLIVAPIYGSDYDGDDDFSTTTGNIALVGDVQFTTADSEDDVIDAGANTFSGTTYYYKVFAIAWSSNQVPTFMLSNEEDGLIDKLIAAGHEDDSLYEVLQLLQPISSGAIPADYMSALAARPADCEAKTAPLSNFSSEFNNPIGIGADGNLIVAQIHGRDYYDDTDFTTTTATIAGVGTVQFTAPDSESDYVDAGTLVLGGVTYYYKTFGIGWMATESDTLTVAGTATDDTAILQIDNKTPSARDKTWDINVTTGTVAAGVAKADVTLSGLPAGLDYTAAKGTGNTVVITLTGAATTTLTADATITATIKGSAVTEADAQDSVGISLKLWYIGEATTLVLTNEAGGLFTKLIAAGHGDDTLYEVLELLQPDFSSVITERFMKTLVSNPDGEIYTVTLNIGHFDVNYPVCINADATVTINPIYAHNYHGEEGYTTTGSNLAGVGTVWATVPDDSAHLINAGQREEGGEGGEGGEGLTFYYKAFAILWMPELPAVTTDTVDTSGVTQNSAAVSGNLTAAGTASVTERGFVYGTSANPTTSDAKATPTGTDTGAFSATLTSLTAATTYHVRAYAISAAGTAYGADREFTTLTGGGGGGGGGGGSTTQTYNAEVKEGGAKTGTLPVTVDTATKTGTASLDAAKAQKLLQSATGAAIVMPSIPGVTSYKLELPASALSRAQAVNPLTVKTSYGSVAIPGDMLSNVTGAENNMAGVTIGQGDTSGLTDVEKAAVGNHPLIQLTLTLGGVQTAWNNPAAPVTVTIPYTPTAAELQNPESIIIWYLDGSGKPVCVPNGHYDAATGTVTFTTTHFSKYAVGYNPVSFNDVSSEAWYYKAVSFIGARGITTGTGSGNYSPDAKLTRGEFIVLLMRAYEIAPDTNPTDNFADAGNTYYTNYLAAAKRLGISNGVGNNMCAPGKEITRQEMFTLLYNALNVIGRLPEGNGRLLSDFTDADGIAPWALEAMKRLVETGIVSGDGGKLNPTGTTTRAEMAQVLYNLLTDK